MSKIQRIIVSTSQSRQPLLPRDPRRPSRLGRWTSVGQEPDGSYRPTCCPIDIAIAVMDKCLKAAGAGAEYVVKVQVS